MAKYKTTLRGGLPCPNTTPGVLFKRIVYAKRKDQLEEYARQRSDIELDKRLTFDNMVEEYRALLAGDDYLPEGDFEQADTEEDD